MTSAVNIKNPENPASKEAADRAEANKAALNKSQKDLLTSGRNVQVQAEKAAKKADFFAPERKQYIKDLRDLMSGSMASMVKSPAYGFRYKQGQKALESSLAAQGAMASGRAGLELKKYGQELASTEFQNQFQRLMSLAGVGQSNPSAAADLMYRGAMVPFNVSQSLADQVFKSAQADKDRATGIQMQQLNHQFELDQIREEAKVEEERTRDKSVSYNWQQSDYNKKFPESTV